MTDELRQELESMAAIFCGDDDNFSIDHNGLATGTTTVFSITVTDIHDNEPTTASERVKMMKTKCVFSIKNGYPSIIPEISFSSIDFTNKSLVLLKKDTLLFSQTLIGMPMLLDIIMWLKQNIGNYNSDNSVNHPENMIEKGIGKERLESADPNYVTAILHLDHMRSRNKYLKTLEKWSAEIRVSVTVIFQAKLIVIILNGKENYVKEFITRQKTVNIDVDSKGRSCKERMLSLLIQVPCKFDSERFQGFTVKETQSRKETADYLKAIGLEEHSHILSEI